jgi:hypothetical protein
MAIQHTDDMPCYHEIPRRPIPPHLKDITNNVYERGLNPSKIPFTDATVENELHMFHTLKQTQLDLTSPPVRHLTGTRNKVIYFSQAAVQYNTDNLNVTAPGSTNATKYNRIENMIIVTEEPLSQTYELGEDGMVQNEVTASAFMFPGIEPQPADLFYLEEVKGRGILYFVTSSTPITSIEETGWRIEFIRHYEQYTPEALNQKVLETYVFLFEAIGTHTRYILEKSLFDLYRTIIEVTNRVSAEYLARFFAMDRNIIYYSYIPKHVVGDIWSWFSCTFGDDGIFKRYCFDPYVIYFFSKVFTTKKLMYEGLSIYPTVPVWIGDSYLTSYKYSIFNAFYYRKPSLIRYRYYTPKPFKIHTITNLAYENWYYVTLEKKRHPHSFNVYPPHFISNIISNTLYTPTEEPHSHDYSKWNIFIKFMNDQTYVPTKEELTIFSDTIELAHDRELYGFAPLLLYILSYYEHLICTKTY